MSIARDLTTNVISDLLSDVILGEPSGNETFNFIFTDGSNAVFTSTDNFVVFTGS